MKIYKAYGLTIKAQYGLLNRDLERRLEREVWEKEEISAIQHIPKESVVLELGGCIGITANLLNKHLSNPQNHVVVEPNPELTPTMLRVRDDNKSQFKMRNCLVGLSSGSETFSLHPNHIMGGRLGGVANWKNIQVEKLTIQELEEIYDLKFDCLIMDVEGAEYDLFLDVDGWLKGDYFTKFNSIMIEFHNTGAEISRCKQIMDAIQSAGYTNTDLGDGVRLFKKDVIQQGEKIKV
tara:strand:- start:125 stop:832 length:708 start_codon:yes stop_codon:yes gene_type:complete